LLFYDTAAPGQAPLWLARVLKSGRCGCISPQIEHRLFAHISMNWRGRPLTSHEVVVDLIGATTTRTGLTVHAEADTNTYPRGIKSSDAQMAAIAPQLKPNTFHGEWNYTVKPAPPRH
jgi:hypothetical protein